MTETETTSAWKHSRVAWAPPYHPTEKWWRMIGPLTLHLNFDGYCDARGNRVQTGDHHTTPPVLALEWAIEDRKRGTWIQHGRLLVRDYPSRETAFLAAQAAAESAAAIYMPQP